MCLPHGRFVGSKSVCLWDDLTITQPFNFYIVGFIICVSLTSVAWKDKCSLMEKNALFQVTLPEVYLAHFDEANKTVCHHFLDQFYNFFQLGSS